MTEGEMAILYSGNIGIDYGQFYIDIALDDEDEDDDNYLDPEEAFDGQKNGICGAAQAGKLFFVTGIQGGVIAIDVEFHRGEPAIDDSYSEIVEVSFRRGETPVSLCEWGHEQTHRLDLPEGELRVRYCIDGMDKDYDEEADYEAPIPGQRHLVQIWKSEPEADSIVKHTSDNAAYWHREWGSLE